METNQNTLEQNTSDLLLNEILSDSKINIQTNINADKPDRINNLFLFEENKSNKSNIFINKKIPLNYAYNQIENKIKSLIEIDNYSDNDNNFIQNKVIIFSNKDY
jgi:hypothetical protein